ncbi:MAG: tetratricopeptide repeat protein [Nitrospirae bacterium]|nr:MAG: tetratricopeptide repeat protein [Nitrospirota bacterium]
MVFLGKCVLIGLLGLTVACSSLWRHPPSLISPDSPPSDFSTVEQRLLDTVAMTRKLGSTHPLHLSALYSLANFYREQGAWAKAAATYQQTLSLKEQAVGAHHPDLVIILRHYAYVLEQTNQSRKAQDLLRRARLLEQASQSRQP